MIVTGTAGPCLHRLSTVQIRLENSNASNRICFLPALNVQDVDSSEIRHVRPNTCKLAYDGLWLKMFKMRSEPNREFPASQLEVLIRELAKGIKQTGESSGKKLTT